MKSRMSSFFAALAAMGALLAAQGAGPSGRCVAESPRELPLEKDVDVLVLGGGTAAVSAAVAAANAGASVFLAAPRPFVGDDVAGTLRFFESEYSKPIEVKRACDKALASAGVGYLTGLMPTDVLVDRRGEVAGAVLAGKSGRAAVRAKHVVDFTDHAAFARAAGVPFEAFKPSSVTFERTVVTSAPPEAEGMSVVERKERALKSGKTYVCRFEMPMADLSYASFAAAEQKARDLTWTAGELDGAERLAFAPPVRAKKSVPHLTLAGAWAREAAAEPSGAAGVGAAAAAAAKKRGAVGAVRVAASRAAAGAAGGIDTKEFLWGFRPYDRGLEKVQVPASSLPVLGEYDTVVVGGGTAGAPSAVAAARGGSKTLLVEYQYGLGGVSTLGMIGKYWYGNKCGFTAELEKGVKEMSAAVYVNAKSEWLRRQARAAGAEIWFGTMACGAVVADGRVAGVVVVTPCGRGVVLAKNVIDATGNADIAAAAGAETEFISDGEIVVQNAGTSVKNLGKSYDNSDWGLVNEGDAYDLWLFQMRGRMGSKAYWDQAGVVGSRERRRIRSVYVPTAVDMVSQRKFPDTIVQAQSNFDSHGSTVDPFCMFKWLSGRNVQHLNVPYRAIIPEKLNGIAVIGLGAGAKHDALPIMRMQADLHNLGYAAGLAAAQAASRGYDMRGVDVRDLQRELVKAKVIDKGVVSWKDSLPDDAKFAAAVVSCAERDHPGLETVLLRPPAEAFAALRKAYAGEKDPVRRLSYAAILGAFGDPAGADALVDFFTGKGPEFEFPVRKKEDGSHADPHGHRLADREMMLVALGRTRDRRAVPVIAAEAEKIDAKCWIGLVRTVALAAEGLADPALAPALEAALARPGVSGHSAKDAMSLPPGGGYKTGTEMYKCLMELNLARALLACGDPNGVARKIFKAYADDPRGIWAIHARAVLEKQKK